MSIAHYSRPLWAIFALTAATCVFLTNRNLRPVSEVWDLPALAEQVRKTDPNLHLIPASKTGDLDEGFYLSERSTSWREVSSLICNPERKHRWRGVALCRENKLNPSRDEVRHEIAEWGDGGLLLGYITIVGDPELVRRIRAALPSRSVVKP
jgi:hypothetical protein